ncbi:hypothetical protein GCM10022260_23860 [Gaetbulibacter aestuarii]
MMSTKVKPEKLLDENSSYKDFTNFALQLCDDIIYDFENYIDDKENLNIGKR